MAVTIGRMTSRVNVVEAGGTLSDETLEQIVELVIRRLREEGRGEEAGGENEIPERMSES
jgi:hypothetical protein